MDVSRDFRPPKKTSFNWSAFKVLMRHVGIDCGCCRAPSLRSTMSVYYHARGNFALRTASSPRRTRRLRPDGLSPLGIRDTGQNTSQVQDAFRSLHYVAVATCRPPLIPTVTSISAPHLGDKTPCYVGDRPQNILLSLLGDLEAWSFGGIY